MTQIGDQCCRKDFGFPDSVSFTFSISILFIPWKSVGFNNSRSTHDCHKRPVPIVKFVSFMIVTSVMYPLWDFCTIPFHLRLTEATCVRRGIVEFHTLRLGYDCHNRPVSVGKYRISHNFVPFTTVTYCLCPWENIVLFAFSTTVMVVVLLGSLCPSENHRVLHTVTLLLLILL